MREGEDRRPACAALLVAEVPLAPSLLLLLPRPSLPPRTRAAPHVIRSKSPTRDDPDAAQALELVGTEGPELRDEAAAEGAPDVFLAREERPEGVGEFAPRDGADGRGGRGLDVASRCACAFAGLVGLGGGGELLVEGGEAGAVRLDEGVRRVEPEEVEDVELLL